MTAKKGGSTAATVDTTNVATSPVPGIADTALTEADDLAPATDVAASGALIEPTIVERIDTDHPSVDNEPRKGVSIASNQIDFNTPSGLQAPEETVAEKLDEQNDK